VADFGVAHSASRQSVVGAVKGKPAYMAPEQLHLAPVDARADVYAVGVVLYEMVTGRRPFEGRMGETLADVSAGRFPPPRAIRPELGPDLEALILTAMARSAADRFSSAAAMGEAIRGYVAIRGHALRRADLGEFVRDLKRASADSSPPPYRPEGAERTRPSSPRSRRMQAIEG
jgi:serine/threonine-protein kinase